MMLDHAGDRTLTDLLDEAADGHAEQVFVLFEDRDGERSELTYRAFADLTRRCAAGLAARGIAQGDCVVVHLGNCPEFLVTWFALARLGAVLVPSNVANTAPELEHILTVTSARLVLTEPRYEAAVRGGIAAAGSTADLVLARDDDAGPAGFAALLRSDDEAPRATVAPLDLAQIIFTSGTTHKPKGVMLTHANCVRAGLHAVHCLWLDEGERFLTALPLFHVNAQAMSVLPAMTVGGTVVLLEEFSASRFWDRVRSYRATQTCLVAMQLRTILAQPPADGERDHAVRRLFFAINVSDTEKEAFEERFGVSLINGYGCTEAMTLLACSPVAAPRRWPSVGLPAAGRRLLLVDDDGREVPPGEVGEVVAEGTPGRDFMLGYFGDDRATAETLRDGRLHTGDNLYADERGYLFFFDRKKDMIKRSGENVAAREVEAVLVEHPAVAEASVIGVPDPVRDEAIGAVIVPTRPGAVTAEEISAYCGARLARFKVPTVIVFADELPKTSIGKVRKDELRKRLAAPEASTHG